MDHVFYVCRFNDRARAAGPYLTRAEASEKMMSYPNPSALYLSKLSGDAWERCSDYAEVGENIQWESGEGTLKGRVDFINRDLPTADPRRNADYYVISQTDGRTSYLNSNMMKMLKVQNLSAGCQMSLV